jgi:hypothetical protein
MDEIVGKTAVGEPGAFMLNDVDRCIWTYAHDPARWVTVSLAAKDAHDQAIEAFGEGERVAGLGDDARWWATSGLVSVAVGEESLQVDLELAPEELSKDMATNIAQVALDNLN